MENKKIPGDDIDKLNGVLPKFFEEVRTLGKEIPNMQEDLGSLKAVMGKHFIPLKVKKGLFMGRQVEASLMSDNSVKIKFSDIGHGETFFNRSIK